MQRNDETTVMMEIAKAPFFYGVAIAIGFGALVQAGMLAAAARDALAISRGWGWAVLAVAATTLVGIGVTWAVRTLAYPLPIAWGLVGAFVAEQEVKPVLAFTALAAAFALVGAGVIIVFGLRRGVERR